MRPVFRQRILLILLISFWGSLSLSAKEEYWKDFFYLIDGNSFDKAPLFYHPLTAREAESMGSYTVVYLNDVGILTEALTFQSREPLYYYYYLYDSNYHPLARISYYFQQSDKAVRNSLVYFYYDQGRLLASSYFEYSLLFPGEKTRTFSKVYDEERKGRSLSELELMAKTDLLDFMESAELKVDQAMGGFQGGELFKRKLVQ
ncbi:MAG: hypothetical protein PQJ59_18730 [Spirochaetales bacterium]|nr:hypothetical protein [Spirochaetales bacterium]